MVWPPAPMAPCDPAQTGCLRLGCRHLVPRESWQADLLPKEWASGETARGFCGTWLAGTVLYVYLYRTTQSYNTADHVRIFLGASSHILFLRNRAEEDLREGETPLSLGPRPSGT